MIAAIRGLVESRGEDHLVVWVGGVGLLVHTTARALAQAEPGQEIHLHTHLYLREDQLALYGFATSEERATFQRLLSVTGVGPRVALGLLSALAPGELAGAVESGDEARLQRVSGVGRRVAQRLIVELKGKLGAVAVPLTSGVTAVPTDDPLVAMLENYGLPRAEAIAVLATLPADPALSEEERIRLAFRAIRPGRG
jgi:Holliday junction DNA helicase RuvA